MDIVHEIYLKGIKIMARTNRPHVDKYESSFRGAKNKKNKNDRKVRVNTDFRKPGALENLNPDDFDDYLDDEQS